MKVGRLSIRVSMDDIMGLAVFTAILASEGVFGRENKQDRPLQEYGCNFTGFLLAQEWAAKSGQIEFNDGGAGAIEGTVSVDLGLIEAVADGAHDEGEVLEAHVHPGRGGIVVAGL